MSKDAPFAGACNE